MNVLLAILGDSLREAVDRKSLFILLAIGLLPIIFCFGVSIEAAPLDEVFAEQVRRVSGGIAEEATVGEVRPVRDGDPWSDELRGGLTTTITVDRTSPMDARAMDWYRRQHAPEGSDVRGEAPEGDEPDRLAFVVTAMEWQGYDLVEGRWRPDDPTVIEVAVRALDPTRIRHASRAHFLFGLFSIPTMGATSVAGFVTGLERGLAQGLVGFLGLIIALISCAGFVPSMLQKGTLDLALARPVSRSTLLVGKYLGGLWYVFLLASLVIGGCWLGLAVGTGYTGLGFLTSIPALLLCFAILHAVSVLVAVLTRSTGVAVLAALAVWFLASNVGKARAMVQDPRFRGALDEMPDWVSKLLDTAWWILPKLTEIDGLNTSAIAASLGSAKELQRDGILTIDLAETWSVLGSSFGFLVCVLTGACIVFSKRDY